MADPVIASASATNTPAVAAPAAAVAPPASVTPAPAVAATDPSQPAEPAKAAVTPPADGVTQEGKQTPPPVEPLFTLPEDFKPPAESVAKFTEAVKSRLVDGKVVASAQDIASLYVDMARDANVQWQKQIEALDKSNKSACEKRFSAEQLKAAESAVGFFGSYDSGFQDFAKRQLNDPVFVNAMRLVGEKLGEDVFEPAGQPAPTKRSAAQIMGYDKKPN